MTEQKELFKEKLARFLYYDGADRAGIWKNLSPLVRQQYLNKADRLFEQAGYVKLAEDQSLPCINETGDYIKDLEALHQEYKKENFHRIRRK